MDAKYKIVFSWGYNPSTGEKYLDCFYPISQKNIDQELICNLLSPKEEPEIKQKSKEIAHNVNMIKIRSIYNNLNMGLIETNFNLSREDLEMYIKYTPDKELQKFKF